MSAEEDTCDLIPVSLLDDGPDTGEGDSFKNVKIEFQQPILSALNTSGLQQSGNHPSKEGVTALSGASSPSAVTISDSESGIFSSESELCMEHDSELDSFCCTEQKVVCSQCPVVGSCQGHTVTRLASRATVVRNQLVDVCEQIQLQALRIERFITHTLSSKERTLQLEAAGARERVVSQGSAVREAVEEEEQRLLEEVQTEQERVEQCLLTQRAHWSQALATLTNTRARLVHTLTHSPDTLLVSAGSEIAERVEEAEGVGEPCDTEQLSLPTGCGASRLMRALWASALLLGPSAHGSANLTFNERTVSSLLSLSDDLCTLTFLPKRARQSPPYDPARFDCWPNALGSLSLSSGTHSWVLDVGQSAAFKVGVCYASVERKGSGKEARLGYNAQSWVLSHYDGDFSFCHAGKSTALQVVHRPSTIGLLLDWPSQTLLFYDPESFAVLHSVRHTFSAPLLPACAVADRSITILH
ncbi:B box and SPRY domain-containing protein [Osmerus mordax]|uniref:B box and SPRY domain-containing protein n=1 Tax=Osmerus mordax TaxID=8014 RepID=UPI00350EBA7E